MTPRNGRGARWLLALALALVVTWGHGFVHELHDREKVGEMTEKMKTVCAGRFLIDLPSGARATLGMTFLQGFRITTLNEADQEFAVRVAAREARINAAKNQAGRRNMESVKLVHENGFSGKLFVFGRNASYTMEYETQKVWEEVVVEGYVHAGGTSFNFVSDGYDPAKAGNLARLVSQLRLLAEDEIPRAPGFCFGRGIILDPLAAEAGERLTLFAALPGHPDVSIAFSTTAGLKRNWPGLLARNAKNTAREPFWVRSAFSTLREGKRTINGLAGEELALKVTEQNFAQGFSFDWEMGGNADDVLAPQVTLELESGRNPHAGGKPVQSSLEQGALTELWDKISSSIRLRPTAPVVAGAAPAPPTPPLGATASAGDTCPQSGWWRCSEGGRGIGVLGGQLQYLKKGQRMPQALLLPPQTLWQKVRGLQPSYESDRPTAWKLVDKRGQARTAAPVPLAQATLAGRENGTTFAPDGSASLAQPAALGSYARTGEPTPASGWWRCDQSQALDGTRWFAQGSLLPAATFQVPPGVFGRSPGAPKVIQRRSMWQLVRYAQAPEAGAARPAPARHGSEDAGPAQAGPPPASA